MKCFRNGKIGCLTQCFCPIVFFLCPVTPVYTGQISTKSSLLLFDKKVTNRPVERKIKAKRSGNFGSSFRFGMTRRICVTFFVFLKQRKYPKKIQGKSPASPAGLRRICRARAQVIELMAHIIYQVYLLSFPALTQGALEQVSA
jgi:hypothetical protein